MTDKEALKLALEALKVTWYHVGTFAPTDEAIELYDEAINAIKSALEAKDEPYAFKASMYSNDRMTVDPVTGNVSIGTPQRTWVGLTQDELTMICDSMKTWSSFTVTDVYFAIQEKLREKNT